MLPNLDIGFELFYDEINV